MNTKLLLSTAISLSLVFSQEAYARNNTIYRDNFETPESCSYAPHPRQLTSEVLYLNSFYRVNPADISTWSGFTGICGPNQPRLDWPQRFNCDAAIVYAQRNRIIAMKFTVPPDPQVYPAGRLQRGDTLDTVSRDTVSIARNCGDFFPPDDTCVIYDGYRGSAQVAWSVDGIVPGTCPLTPNATYYLNITMDRADGAGSWCDSSSCEISFVQQQIATGVQNP